MTHAITSPSVPALAHDARSLPPNPPAPLRIVLVNWARIWDGAGYGGGVNGYCQSLGLSLTERGHDVVSLFGGVTFVPAPTPDVTSPCFIRRHDDWLGIRVFEVVNSPVMAPSIVQYQRPLDEVSSPELESEVERLFTLLKPDVVHFHNIEGFSIGCVDVARRVGARVVFSLHNYHTICPQVYLMQGHRRICHDSRAGHACTNCIETKDPLAERRDRAQKYPTHPTSNIEKHLVKLRTEISGEWSVLRKEALWPLRMVKKSVKLVQLRREIARLEATANEGRSNAGRFPLPGHAVDTIESVTKAREVPAFGDAARREENVLPGQFEADEKKVTSPDTRGQTQFILDELHTRPRTLDLTKPERAPVLNIALPDPPHDLAPNDYGRRRAAMVKGLSSCDRVLAVSDFVRDKFIAMGVDPKVIGTMHIGSRINRVMAKASELVFDPPEFAPAAGSTQPGNASHAPEPSRPIRLVFMGYNNYYKGLHVLVDALEMLTPEYLRHLDLSIFALDGRSIEWVFRRLEPRLARLVFVPGYNYHDIPWMLGGKDLGIVPSVWWDNAPQTVFEFFAGRLPVLASAVGGIPDFVIDEVNGMLFRGNDPFDLAAHLALVVREPWRLTEMRRHVKPPKDIDEHVLELERLYGEKKAPPVA